MNHELALRYSLAVGSIFMSSVTIAAPLPQRPGIRRPHGADRRSDRIKAPPNGFILFRSDYKAVPDNQVVADGRKKKQTEITKGTAAACQKELPKTIRDEYLTRARILNLAEHKRKHRDYWYQRLGRDGRFMGVPGSGNNSMSAHGGGEPDSAPLRFLPCPLTVAQPLPSPGGLPAPICSFGVDPGFFSCPWVPPPHILPTAPAEYIRSFPFPTVFDAMAPVNSPPQVLPFHHLPATSSNPSLSLPAHCVSSSADVLVPPPVASFPHDLVPSLCAPTDYQGYPNWDRGGSASSKQGTVRPQLPSQPTTHDFSSRTLTLSRSDWEMVELFLGAGTPSGTTISTTIPHCSTL
ncbi:hypothetical protein V8D89_001163 [Ganoderma adspersum]